VKWQELLSLSAFNRARLIPKPAPSPISQDPGRLSANLPRGFQYIRPLLQPVPDVLLVGAPPDQKVNQLKGVNEAINNFEAIATDHYRFLFSPPPSEPGRLPLAPAALKYP
jgi:hypothetical protein